MVESELLSLVVSIGDEILNRSGDTAMAEIIDLRKNTTVMDLWAHREYVDGLNKIRPGVPVITEESADPRLPADGTFWIVDPLDGTSSWQTGYDGFVTQCALFENHQIVKSVIYWPSKKIHWTYSIGKGCSFSGKKPKDASSGFSIIDNYPIPSGLALRLFESITKIKGCSYVEKGSIALKMMYVCEHWSSLFCKDVLFRLWDIAPVVPFARAENILIADRRMKPLAMDRLLFSEGLIVCSKQTDSAELSLIRDTFDEYRLR